MCSTKRESNEQEHQNRLLCYSKIRKVANRSKSLLQSAGACTALIVTTVLFAFMMNIVFAKIEARRFIDAPGPIEAAYGSAFHLPYEQRPCHVPEIEKVRFKVVSTNPPRAIYSCNTYYLDNIIIRVLEFTGNGSRDDYVEESSVLPVGHPLANIRTVN